MSARSQVLVKGGGELLIYLTGHPSVASNQVMEILTCVFYYSIGMIYSVPSVQDGIMLILLDRYVSFLVPIMSLASKMG